MFEGKSYLFAQLILSKGTAITFLLAFIVAFRQCRGLFGKEGVLPVEDFVKQESFLNTISLFYFLPSEKAMKFSAILGIILSFSTLFGFPSMISPFFSSLNWFLIWFLFLSFVNTGQKFYEHGWELILLESGFLMIFAGGLSTKMSETLIWLFRWLLFRMILGSGLVKLHGDEAWKNLTALNYHFETQAFPNPLSWYFHHLPKPVLKAGVLITYIMLLGVPLLYFLPQPFAAIGGILTILYQILIFSTGNYTWLNLITSVLTVSTFSDKILTSSIPFTMGETLAEYPYTSEVIVLSGVIGVLSLPVVKNMLSRNQSQNKTFDSLHLVNSYGAFGKIERERKEIILEATDKINPNENDWEEYRHYEKPDLIDERPRQISPYHHRIDYPFKFVQRNSKEKPKWLKNLTKKLLENSSSVENLFKEIPHEDPKSVRATLYKYRFTTPGEKSRNGNWWKRERIKTIYEQN